MSFKRVFSGDIYHVRKEKGWSQQYVADKTNISVRQYQNIEKGGIVPYASTVFKLIKLFDMDANKYKDAF